MRLFFGEEFLTQDWRSRTNLDISSLFTALALQVRRSVEEVQRITSLVLRPKWAGGLQEVVARVVIGEGLKSVEGPCRRIGVDIGELQPFVIWSASRSVVFQVEDARKGWDEIVNFVHQLGPTEHAKIHEKMTPIQSETPLGEDGRPLVRHQLPKKLAKVVERGSLCENRPQMVPGGGSMTLEAGPSRGIPNFSREEALGWFRS